MDKSIIHDKSLGTVVPFERFLAHPKFISARYLQVYYGRCANGDWNPVPFVRYSCYCRCGRERSDIKRDGKVPCFIISHWGKKKTQSHLEYDNLIFFITSGYTHVWKNNDKPSSVSVGLNLVSCFLSWVLIWLNSWPSTVYSFSMHRTIHFFQIHSHHLITHVRKLNT